MKKIVLLLAACMLILFSTNKQNAQTKIWDKTDTIGINGTGTQDAPYIIESAEQMAYIVYIVNNGIGSDTRPTIDKDIYLKLMITTDSNGIWIPVENWDSGEDYYNFDRDFDGHTVLLERIDIFGSTERGSIKNSETFTITVTPLLVRDGINFLAKMIRWLDFNRDLDSDIWTNINPYNSDSAIWTNIHTDIKLGETRSGHISFTATDTVTSSNNHRNQTNHSSNNKKFKNKVK